MRLLAAAVMFAALSAGCGSLGRTGRGDDDLAVTYRLDDALFGMFPSDDAEVNPILDEPPD